MNNQKFTFYFQVMAGNFPKYFETIEAPTFGYARNLFFKKHNFVNTNIETVRNDTTKELVYSANINSIKG